MTMPALCRHHASVYRTRAAAIRHLPHGHKALAREARLAMTDHGGFVCPVPHCGHREFVQSLIDDHVRKMHPEEKRP